VLPDIPTEQEIRAFVGPRADTYLAKWKPLLNGVGTGSSFNWAAFFLSGLWLSYRKMYLAATIFFGFLLLEIIAEHALFVWILGKPEPPKSLDRIVGIAIAITCGSLGNTWYLSHTRKAVTAVRSQGLSEEAHLQALAKRGGTNIAAAVGFGLLFFMVACLVVILLDLPQLLTEIMESGPGAGK
jgi:Protein of unknown function (DUF2628)